MDARYEIVAGSEADHFLAGLGLSNYANRIDVFRQIGGATRIEISEGEITVDVDCVHIITMKDVCLLLEVPEVIKSLREAGMSI